MKTHAACKKRSESNATVIKALVWCCRRIECHDAILGVDTSGENPNPSASSWAGGVANLDPLVERENPNPSSSSWSTGLANREPMEEPE